MFGDGTAKTSGKIVLLDGDDEGPWVDVVDCRRVKRLDDRHLEDLAGNALPFEDARSMGRPVERATLTVLAASSRYTHEKSA